MDNKKARQMMVDVEKSISMAMGNSLDDRSCIVWFDGPCLIAGGNFIWLSSGVVSLTADQHRAIK
ncbi:hypothetical protein VPHK375_0033 [Vibrio phage K375]